MGVISGLLTENGRAAERSVIEEKVLMRAQGSAESCGERNDETDVREAGERGTKRAWGGRPGSGGVVRKQRMLPTPRRCGAYTIGELGID